MKYILPLIALTLAACSADDLNDRTLTRPDAGEDFGTDGGNNGGGSDAETPDMGEESDLPYFGDVGPIDMGGSGICRPNKDGVIEREEIALQPGLSAKFLVASEETWSTAPEDVDGEPTWDLAQDFDSDETTLVELRDLSGEWFETTFPDADYYTPLSTNSDLLGVFQITDDALLLLGVVSPEESAFGTEVEYDPPLPVLQFPLQAGDRWTVESDVSGTYNGVFTLYTETYVFEADEAGTLLTPYGTFPSIRVRSVLDREIGLLTTVIRSFAFVTECFGTVATVTSQEDETEAEFSDIAELRRLTP